MKVILIAAALLAAPAQAADQFNLDCKGQWRFRASDPFEPTAQVFRFALAKKKYCEGECKARLPIAEIGQHFLELRTATDEEKVLGTIRTNRIDRTTGRYIYFLSQRRPSHSFIEVEMMCEPKPFTGFPVLQTKF